MLSFSCSCCARGRRTIPRCKQYLNISDEVGVGRPLAKRQLKARFQLRGCGAEGLLAGHSNYLRMSPFGCFLFVAGGR